MDVVYIKNTYNLQLKFDKDRERIAVIPFLKRKVSDLYSTLNFRMKSYLQDTFYGVNNKRMHIPKYQEKKINIQEISRPLKFVVNEGTYTCAVGTEKKYVGREKQNKRYKFPYRELKTCVV